MVLNSREASCLNDIDFTKSKIVLPQAIFPSLLLPLSLDPNQPKAIIIAQRRNRKPSQSLEPTINATLLTFQNTFAHHHQRPMNHDLLDALNVRVVGNGDRVLVLSHGFGTDQSAWQRILPSFLPRYRVVLYDLVCAGSVNPGCFDFRRYSTLDGYVDDLLSILDALGIDRCAYVGHSVSAMIGILAAIRRPSLFTKLVLIGASPRFLNDEDYDCGFEQEQIEQVFTAMQSNYEAWVNGYAPLAVGSDVPAAVREFSRTLFNMRPDISLFALRTVFSSDLRGVLGLVTVPCCIVQTAHDVAIPASAATYLTSHLGGPNTVEVVETEGHLPHLTAPRQLAEVLRRVLSR